MAHMGVPVGIGGSVVETELLLGLPLSLPGVELCEATRLHTHTHIDIDHKRQE